VSSQEPFREKKVAGDPPKLIDRPSMKPTVFCVEIDGILFVPCKKRSTYPFFSQILIQAEELLN